MSDFKIKRGMVFYLENPTDNQPVKCISSYTPEKKRPYMVVSNNKCNEHSALIHIAPIISREPSAARQYQVPFKSTCDRDCVVDIASIMLVPKEILNEKSYSAAITQYTIANHILLEGIGRAVMRQFDVETDVSTVASTPIQPLPGITLNININGMPIMPRVSQTQNDITVDLTPIESNTPASKENTPVEVVSNGKTPFRKVNLTRYKTTSPQDKEYMKTIIMENWKGFGGTMSCETIAKNIGVSYSTINRIAKSMRSEIKTTKTTKKKYKSYNTAPGQTKFNLTPEQDEQLYTDFYNHNAKYCLEKYKDFGFESVLQIYGRVRLIRDKKNKNKIK